jgi:hypothetical protein
MIALGIGCYLIGVATPFFCTATWLLLHPPAPSRSPVELPSSHVAKALRRDLRA